MVRSDINAAAYLEVKDSASLQQFGEKYLKTPGSRSQLNLRVFINLLPAEVLARKAEVSESKTIAGISSKFQYVCKVFTQPCVIVL